MIHRYPSNPDTNLTREEIDDIIENAFSFWSAVTPLQFSRVPNHQSVDINLSFEQGLHYRGHQNPDSWDAFNVPPLHWAHAGTGPGRRWSCLLQTWVMSQCTKLATSLVFITPQTSRLSC